MVEVTMTMDEYLTLLGGLSDAGNDMDAPLTPEAPKKKRSSAYQKRYKANFKKVAPRFKLKSGKWKKNGFKMAVKEAHKSTRKGQVRKTARRAYEK